MDLSPNGNPSKITRTATDTRLQLYLLSKSGTVKIEKRPAGGKLVKAIQNRAADAVIFPRIDRLSRETRPVEFLGIVQLCDDSQVRLHLANRGEIDLDNPWPLIAHYAKQVKAEEKKNRFRENPMNGRLDKARAGKIVMIGITPYGYCRESRGPDARLVIDPEEAAII